MNTDAHAVNPEEVLLSRIRRESRHGGAPRPTGTARAAPAASLTPRLVRGALHDARMAQSTDLELMDQFQSEGDYAAFEALFLRHRDGLLGFLQRLAADASIAEDVSQWTWLRVIETARRRGFAPMAGAALRTWLFTLARNRYVDDYLRRADVARVVPFPDGMADCVPEETEQDDPYEHYVNAGQLRALIDAALRDLPFQQREVLSLWCAGFDAQTIARLTSAPRDTVLSRKKYALAKLRAALASAGVTQL